MTVADQPEQHPAWLPPEAFRDIGSRRVLVSGLGILVDTVRAEISDACARHGGALVAAVEAEPEVVLALRGEPLPAGVGDPGVATGPEGFLVTERGGVTLVLADDQAGLLYGFFHLVRGGEPACPTWIATGMGGAIEHCRPALRHRMLDHWDNVAVHPVMGQVERGYAGGSVFWRDGAARGEPGRVRAYGRLLAACGINAVAVNNVNVHAAEAHLLTDRIGEVAAIADELRPYGVRVHLSVTFAAPVVLGGLGTADPLDEAVWRWWQATTDAVYAAIPDFGGYLVKADSEGQPGPFGYGRSHADGANVLADALAPHGGVVHWRAFVYDHRQDWRDRSTDRARAAYDHFTPLDGEFRHNAVLQVKHGPIDFQVREPVSPVLAAMPATRLAVEFQATQEYTGQQRHACYLAPMWREVLGFRPRGDGTPTVAELASELVAVSNVGDDRFWTGHPLAQANLYAFGRLAWAPESDPGKLLDEWIGLTFAGNAALERIRAIVHELLDDSWHTYERYTAPLGVGFMVRPGHHYGPDVDGYEYTPWGTYHFADRDGIGVDRTRATGTGFTGQYPVPWADTYERLDSCPDELLLFFHHVPYGHVLHSGVTVVQHIYDTHFDGAARVAELRSRWQELAGLVDAALHERVAALLDEQLRSAEEWRDQLNTYFYRKSGVPDAHGRRIY